jgi:6-pyruvoyltetrahydropterin/6-carboxytetrahydropterin synthase
MTHQVTKTFSHELGLSACFRQWRADGHCKYLHGYALSFKFTFEADELDKNGWVIDFGALKQLKARLVSNFDHRLCIATDDPALVPLSEVAEKYHCAEPIVFKAVGCEAFARLAYDMAVSEIFNMRVQERVRVVSCECAEHGANSAIYKP